MRILHVIHSFPPESHGGTENYVCDVASGQRARGHEVAVAAGSERTDRRDAIAREDHGGLETWRLRAPQRSLAALAGVDAEVRGALESLLARLRPQLVHVHHWHNLTSDVVATARRAGAAAVVTLHDLWVSCPLFFRLPDARDLCPPSLPLADCVRCVARFAGAAEPEVARLFDVRREVVARELALAADVLTLSEVQRAFLAEALPGATLSLLPLPSPPVQEVPRPARRPIRSGELTIASWGGLDRGKGLLTLIEAAERLERPERVAIEHFGRKVDAAFHDEVVRAARRVRLELHGPFTIGELAAASARFDLAVFPSLYLETHGFVVDEALGLGLPVLVSDRGAPKERIGTRGRVFPAGDVAALAELLGRCREGALLDELAAGTRPMPIAMGAHLDRLDEVYARAIAQEKRKR